MRKILVLNDDVQLCIWGDGEHSVGARREVAVGAMEGNSEASTSACLAAPTGQTLGTHKCLWGASFNSALLITSSTPERHHSDKFQ